MLDTSKIGMSVKMDIVRNEGTSVDYMAISARAVEADAIVGQMTTEQAFRYWCGWKFGSRDWGDEIIAVLDQLRAAQEQAQ